jgi:ADP-ribose pyrophosphatase YjhB (NUDIX family)
MVESIIVTHHIQKYIIDVLMYKEFARFSELRPPRTDTNLFAYHLKLLQKAHIIDKTENGYTLTGDGLSYVDRVSTEKKIIRTQPKIITMLLVQNSNGDLLLQKRDKQPYINSWTLPYGKLHIEDATLEAAARREASDKLGFTPDNIRHAGDCYIRVTSNGELLSTTLAHVFRFEHDDIVARDDLQWVRPHKLNQYKLAPAVEAIVARSFFNDQFFFEEFDTVW